MRNKRLQSSALRVALIGVMAATIEAGKMALSAIPNVEVVTLFVALFGYVFGWMGLAATFIFVGIETLIWGFNTWVFSYLIHWPAICIVFWILGCFRVKNRIWLTLAAVFLTIAFGVSSSLIDVAMFMRDGVVGWNTTNYWYRFGIYYMRGIWFYVAQVATNVIAFPVLFPVLSRLLGRLALKYGIVAPIKGKNVPLDPPDLPEEEPLESASMLEDEPLGEPSDLHEQDSTARSGDMPAVETAGEMAESPQEEAGETLG